MEIKQARSRELEIGSNLITFYDINREISIEFENLYQEFFAQGILQLNTNFIRISEDLFSSLAKNDKINVSDIYFSNFTVIANKLLLDGRIRMAINFWSSVIDFVREWERKTGGNIHKGTPYYFLGVADIWSMDFDAAFCAMYLALEEDKRNVASYKDKPAYCFLTLNDQKPDQYLKRFVDVMSGFIKDRLDGKGNEDGKYKDDYQNCRMGSLTYEELRQKFFDNPSIDEAFKYLFSYSLIKTWRLRVLKKNNFGDAVLAPLLFIQVLGPFLITIECLLKLKYGSKNLCNLFIELSENENWITPDYKKINIDRDQNFDDWLDQYLQQNTLAGDFSLAYGLRNFSFHTIESQQKLWQEYTKVLQSIWNCFFKTVEVL